MFPHFGCRCLNSKQLAWHRRPHLLKIVGIVSGMTAVTKYTYVLTQICVKTFFFNYIIVATFQDCINEHTCKQRTNNANRDGMSSFFQSTKSYLQESDRFKFFFDMVPPLTYNPANGFRKKYLLFQGICLTFTSKYITAYTFFQNFLHFSIVFLLLK